MILLYKLHLADLLLQLNVVHFRGFEPPAVVSVQQQVLGDCFHNFRANQRKQISRGCPTEQQRFVRWHQELWVASNFSGPELEGGLSGPVVQMLVFFGLLQVVIRFWSGAVGQQAWGHLELFMTV